MTVLLNDLETSSPSVRQGLEDRDSRGGVAVRGSVEGFGVPVRGLEFGRGVWS